MVELVIPLLTRFMILLTMVAPNQPLGIRNRRAAGLDCFRASRVLLGLVSL
jgi:hypothetical protein